jgi:hypothetical protein
MSGRTRTIVEATGMISVVAGLLLVAYQINQATNIASAQARADFSAGWRSLDSTRQSENFAEVLAKSIYSRSELTPGEILELDAYYTGIVDQLLTAKADWDAGVRSSNWQVTVDFVAPAYFGSEFSRDWWNLSKGAYAKSDGELVAAMDAAIRAAEPDLQKRLIDALQRTTN